MQSEHGPVTKDLIFIGIKVARTMSDIRTKMLGGSTIGAAGALQNINSSSASSYSNERTPTAGLDVEFASDAASGGFFHADYKKHDDLKQMLDSNKDHLKLEAMKRIIGMVAKGRDASDLFPAVVKNVVSKNIEVKKLVYVYLVRYAEEQQDLALLSISTFQRALKDPNQLIRASALRVLSSIRVSMIVPIVMLAIRDSASDMSPYVRKTAAHAIPKLYSLDVEQKDELITVIEKLLSDRTTLVVGSAVMAFEEVCPERVDLIHKNYRKLCNLLVDVDEWGQVIIINMLTRYARTQFIDPNIDENGDCVDDGSGGGGDTNRPFYDETSSSESDDDDDDDEDENATKKASRQSPRKSANYTLDPDHRLLLRQTKPLLQSRNASVVMIVVQLYHHVAPRNEVSLVAKALIRLLRSHKEVQSVVLTGIASMSTQRKSIFEAYLKSFFVRTSDPTHIKLLKLEILTNLATAASIPIILREFQTYISSSDKNFVAATIQAIGRCAASIKEVTETCLVGLVHLLSNRDEYVVAESVVVIKNLLQTQAADHFEIISQMAKLIDFITVPAARASILWLIGEYGEKVPKIAPDVLRKMAKSFVEEENMVKLQILNLSVKLYLTNPQQTELLCQYVFNLARYDENYDIRDRARFLKPFIFPADGNETILSKNARKIFLAAKPAPLLESKYHGREQYQLGSLSHYLNIRATGYHDLPPFPTEAPDSSVRDAAPEMDRNADYIEESARKDGSVASRVVSGAAAKSSTKNTSKKSKSSSDKDNDISVVAESKNTSNKSKSFYSDSDKSSSEYSSENDESSSENEDESGESDDDENESSEDGSSSNEGSSNSDLGSESEDESSSESEPVVQKTANSNSRKNVTVAPSAAPSAKAERSNLDLLLDLDDIAPVGPIMTPSFGGFLSPSPIASVAPNTPNRFELVGPSHIPLVKHVLLNKINGQGLQIHYRFTRAPHLYSAKMVSIELTLKNDSNNDIESIHVSDKSALTAGGIQLNEFAPVAKLVAGQSTQNMLGIDFNDSTQSIGFDIKSSAGLAHVSLRASVGELIRSVQIGDTVFKEEQARLRGMNEHSATVTVSDAVALTAIRGKIFEVANVAVVNPMGPGPDPNTQTVYFSGQTMASQSLVLIAIVFNANDKQVAVTVNCEKMVVGSMLLNDIKLALQNLSD